MFIQPFLELHSVHEQELFPFNLNDLISENHTSRLIDFRNSKRKILNNN